MEHRLHHRNASVGNSSFPSILRLGALLLANPVSEVGVPPRSHCARLLLLVWCYVHLDLVSSLQIFLFAEASSDLNPQLLERLSVLVPSSCSPAEHQQRWLCAKLVLTNIHDFQPLSCMVCLTQWER